MKKRCNIENELKKHYKKEADGFVLPDEKDIRALVFEKKKKANRFAARKFATMAACLVVMLAVLLSVPLINQLKQGTPPPDISGSYPTGDKTISNVPSTGISDPGDSTTVTNPPIVNPPVTNDYPDLTQLSLSEWLENEDVIWSAADGTKGNSITGIVTPMGTVKITDELSTLIADKTDDNTVYAVLVDFYSTIGADYAKRIVCGDKTAADLLAEASQLLDEGKKEESKLLFQKYNDAKERYYYECLESFQESFSKMGLGIYHEKWGCTIDKCYFYTFATKAQIEDFVCKDGEAFTFTIAVRFK